MGSALEPGQDLQGSCTVSPEELNHRRDASFPSSCALFIIGKSQHPIFGLVSNPGDWTQGIVNAEQALDL